MILTAKPEHEVFYQDVVALISRHGDKVDAAEMLAIAANMIGKLIAFQDQRTMTRDAALEIVLRNIELGNQDAMEEISNTKGRA